MKTAKVRLTNPTGLHARAATKLVRVASKYESSVRVGHEKMVDGKSILSLMMLAAVYDTDLRIEAEGPDEDRAIDALRELIKSGFGEIE